MLIYVLPFNWSFVLEKVIKKESKNKKKQMPALTSLSSLFLFFNTGLHGKSLQNACDCH